MSGSPQRRRKRPTIHLYKPFRFDDEGRDEDDFLKGYIAVEQRLRQIQDDGFKARLRELNRKKRLYDKAFAAIREAVRTGDPVATADKIKCDSDLLQTVNEVFEKLDEKLSAGATTASVAEPSSENLEPQQKPASLKRTLRLLKMHEEVHDIVGKLSPWIEKGDVESAKLLLEIAQFVVGMLQIHVNRAPELFRGTARKSYAWPVLASPSGEWTKKAKKTLSTLEFGTETFYAKYRSDLKFDKDHPARSYARALIENIEFNRYFFFSLKTRMLAVKSLVEEGYGFEDPPEWTMDTAKLPEFEASSVPQWMDIAKRILRQQHTDFHLRPEWRFVATQFETCQRGRIQNKIFDHIRSAMKTIAKA